MGHPLPPTSWFTSRMKPVRLTYRRKIALWGFLFTVPAIALLLVFSLFPISQAIYLSFSNYNSNQSLTFVGLKNYLTIFEGEAFPNSLGVSLIYVFGTVIPVWFLSFGLALLLSKVRRLAGLWRTLIFLPTVMPLLTVTLVWKLFFHYRGVMNSLLQLFNLGPVGWLTQSTYAPAALIITSWWHAPSYYMILFLAGLQAIPTVYDEAAHLDGANAWQRLRYVTLPLLRPTIVLVAVLSIINGFRTFAIQHVMTGGGPGTSTEIVTLLIYKTAFNFGNMGDATAMSVIYFLLILVFSLIQMRVLRGEDHLE